MSNITASMVQELRKRTGVGMTKCKEALVESGGDMEAAIDFLRKAGAASAVKKSARETNEGAIGFVENEAGIALVEVNAETDFVTQNDLFKEYLTDVCNEALHSKQNDVAAFLEQQHSNKGETIEEGRIALVQAIGENIQIKRVAFMPKQQSHSYGIYSHMGGKIVVAVELAGSDSCDTLARDVAMHAAAEGPEYLRPEDVPSETIERERAIAQEQVKNKPANIIDKIVDGKLGAFYDQVCLPRQKFVKDPSVTVAQYVESEGKEKGATLTISAFIRWQVGE